MNLTVKIPDDLAKKLGTASELERRALEALALEEFKAGHITKVELRELLGVGRIALDGVLKAHDIYENYTIEEFEREHEDLRQLGF
jgi:hypothetical protein